MKGVPYGGIVVKRGLGRSHARLIRHSFISLVPQTATTSQVLNRYKPGSEVHFCRGCCSLSPENNRFNFSLIAISSPRNTSFNLKDKNENFPALCPSTTFADDPPARSLARDIRLSQESSSVPKVLASLPARP